MGSYIQIGVCTEVRLDKAAFAAAKLTKEEAVQRLTRDFIDMSIFDQHETDDKIRWALPAKLVEEGLVPFLRAQYALLGEDGPKDAKAILARISKAGSYGDIIALAEEKSMPYFQLNTIHDYASLALPRGRLRVETDVLLYLIEGKAIMESYRGLFRYVEALIHGQRGAFPIAGAVKVFLE